MRAARMILLFVTAAFLTAPALADVIFVNADAAGLNNGSNWANAFVELQSALAIAESGDAIWIAEGTYLPDYDVLADQHTADAAMSFELAGGVSIYGGFAGHEATLAARAGLFDQTILSGDLLGDDGSDFTNRTDNALYALDLLAAGDESIVDGVTVVGATIYAAQSDRPTIVRNCSFRDNSGRGYLVEGGTTFKHCRFEYNRGGMLMAQGGSATLIDCHFIGNTPAGNARGAGIYQTNGAGSLHAVNCSFIGNRVTGNQGGGAIYSLEPVKLVNCLFSGNTSSGLAGAIYQQGEPITVLGCTFANNSANATAGLFAPGLARVFNTIFWGNSDAGGTGETAQLVVDGADVVTLDHNCIQNYAGIAPGQFIISTDPLFMNALGVDGQAGTPDDDLRLGAGSSCIDAGRNGVLAMDELDVDSDGIDVELVPVDLDGVTRLLDDPATPDSGHGSSGIVDIGAFERHVDCNGNGTLDAQDIGGARSLDCNANGVPDECEDCNANGIADDCDLALDSALDGNANGVHDGCEGVLFVRANASGSADGSSWTNAYPELQSALLNAQAPDSVWVGQGLYRPVFDVASGTYTSDRNAAFRPVNGVTVYGGFEGDESAFAERAGLFESTVLSGDIGLNDTVADATRAENSYHVIVSQSSSPTAAFDGLTIRGGNANGAASERQQGGGVLHIDGRATFSNCIFDDNRATLGGGAVAAVMDLNTRAAYLDCRFEHNQAGDGGAAYNAEWGGLDFVGCLFDDNEALDNGGAVAAEGHGSIKLEDCVLRNNHANDGGGAAYGNDGDVHPTACVFEGNSAGSSGGAMFADYLLKPQNCEFIDNTASSGGAIYMRRDLTLVGCRLFGNQATGAGGAISMTFSSDCVLVNTMLGGNTAGDGGAIFLDNGIQAVNSVFAGNSATFRGGAVYFFDDTGQNSFKNCTFFENTAGIAGGGVYTNVSNMRFENCILWANEDASGTGASAQLAAGLTPLIVSMSNVMGGWSGAGFGNISADPLFIDAAGADNVTGTADDDLRPESGSPCVDAGSNSLVGLDLQDLDDDDMTLEPVPTDAAGQPRLVNDLPSPDTGDVIPQVDMGAFELQGDCNGNDLVDADDIVSGISQDCDLNSVPDDCEADCNYNGLGDACDLAAYTSFDCNANAVPDECEEDCDNSGVIDACEISANLVLDCNCNGVPDACDLGSGRSLDGDDDGTPDECQYTRVYVDPQAAPGGDGGQWASALPDLREALQRAACPGMAAVEIWVKAGTYLPGDSAGTRLSTFEVDGNTRIYGGFDGTEDALDQRDPLANPTVLSGDLLGNDVHNNNTSISDNSLHVVTVRGWDSTPLFDGLTIRDGAANDQVSMPFDQWDLYGGGVLNVGGRPTFRSCVFEDNFGSSGGGIANVAGGDLTIVDSKFLGNQRSIYIFKSAASITGSRFTGNLSPHGNILVHLGHAFIDHCLFDGNTFGAVSAQVAYVEVLNSVVVNNAASTYTTGGISLIFGELVVRGTTVAGNTTLNTSGSGIFVIGTLELANSIVWGNSNGGVMNEAAQVTVNGDAQVDYSCIMALDQLASVGTGNTGANPLLSASYALQSGSSGIDSADSTAICALADLAGNPRRLDDPQTPDAGNGRAPMVDMGAYEFVPADCDDNGIADTEDISGGAPDANGNGIPDSCELDLEDCNANGADDACDVAARTRAFSGLMAPIDGNNPQTATLPDVLPAASDVEIVVLASAALYEPQDHLTVLLNGQVLGVAYERIDSVCSQWSWPPFDKIVVLAEDFNNALGSGPAVFTLAASPDVPPCQYSWATLLVRYNAANDCNATAVPDDCEIAAGEEQDCNANGQLDSCEPPTDCNNSGIPDICEAALDYNGNGTIDACEPCTTFTECADPDGDGVRNNPCVWFACDSGTCQPTPTVFADIGGGNGACPPDQAADANDRFHALNCFANQSTLGTVGYPCEPAPPAARNADAGGAFGACQPDGVCDGNDAFHALNAFAGVSPCQCQEGQSPLPVPPVLVPPPEQARLVLRLAESKAAVGQVMVVDVFLATGLHDLRGYQLHFGITGGQRGHLELVDLSLEPGSKSHAPAFAGLPAWSAHNLQTAQLLVGLDTPGVQVGAGAYLGTATFRPSRDAYGRFAIDLLVDRHDPQQRTFLFPTSPGASIELVEVEGVVVDVGDVAVGAQAAREQTARGPQGVTP